MNNYLVYIVGGILKKVRFFTENLSYLSGLLYKHLRDLLSVTATKNDEQQYSFLLQPPEHPPCSFGVL